jgi:hypothetical protein
MEGARTKRRRELIVEGPTYYSQGDEAAFFAWLQAISCISDIVGQSTGLRIQLKRTPSKSDLRELIGLLYRYNMNMKPLAAFKTARNAKWFAAPRMFWHAKVFGGVKKSRRN